MPDRDWIIQSLMAIPNSNDGKAGQDSHTPDHQIVRFIEESITMNDSDSDMESGATASSSQNSVFFSNDIEQHILPADDTIQSPQGYNIFGRDCSREAKIQGRARHMSAPHRFHSGSGAASPSHFDNTPTNSGTSLWDRRTFGRNSVGQLMSVTRSSPQPIPPAHLDLELSSSFGENSFQNRPVAETPDKDLKDPLDLLKNLNIKSSPGTEAFYNYFS